VNGLKIPTDSSHRQIFFPCQKLYLLNDEIADLLRKHGGKTGEELKAEGKQKQSHSNS
jgi:hypothetical protein